MRMSTTRDNGVTVLLAVGSHTISIRVGAWLVETLNSTSFTECVFRNVSVECVGGQII